MTDLGVQIYTDTEAEDQFVGLTEKVAPKTPEQMRAENDIAVRNMQMLFDLMRRFK